MFYTFYTMTFSKIPSPAQHLCWLPRPPPHISALQISSGPPQGSAASPRWPGTWWWRRGPRCGRVPRPTGRFRCRRTSGFQGLKACVVTMKHRYIMIHLMICTLICMSMCINIYIINVLYNCYGKTLWFARKVRMEFKFLWHAQKPVQG